MDPVKYLKSADLMSWLEELARENKVFAPRYEGDAVIFAPFDPKQEISIKHAATMPPKKTVFPQSEKLVDFTYSKDPENLSRILIEAKEILPKGTTVVFGSRPCDVRGFTMFDRVYLAEKTTDVYYKARRENTSFITLACEKPETTCFCHWVDSSPSDASGSDVLATPIEDGYVLEPFSEKGQKLLTSSLLENGERWILEVKDVHENAAGFLANAPDLSQAPQKLLDVFDNMEFWENAAAKCLSCGACTYLCPSCYCFNITDETTGMKGTRFRSWDNCMSAQFTMEASGHNPRPTKAHRLKNRVGHKFSYYPAIHDGVISCCGCGRCIKSCPVGIDIREIVQEAINHEPAIGKE
ncbi:MAG: 4Fe-4S dicluster domain-containing protein [Proteobacteria bacterium]|jgi:ferredoxin|nr:hydrogenase [Desulfocapsa sp.]MBU3944378.1 4Fe-4S dicluster domain-containing protein [Pseudomonadota bacterium]MCG2743992.1 4Fe-4S dicluster domain-containing protein [Desulfobacteraceae bacterium]MBU4029893.1 4Fe-4S dicluster domain-containing protein [Pseudomonadota bacterium]MBU4043043.1 4Fe-4S dicluster domain-containing protein [Pseudomonadota bacterium]